LYLAFSSEGALLALDLTNKYGIMILRRGVKALLSLVGLSLFAPATAQIQVLINDKGRTIAIPQNLKERDEFIIERMRHAGGSWRIQVESGEKGCVARRSVSSLKKGVGTKWVVGRGETSREAELDAVPRQHLWPRFEVVI